MKLTITTYNSTSQKKTLIQKNQILVLQSNSSPKKIKTNSILQKFTSHKQKLQRIKQFPEKIIPEKQFPEKNYQVKNLQACVRLSGVQRRSVTATATTWGERWQRQRREARERGGELGFFEGEKNENRGAEENENKENETYLFLIFLILT